MRILCITDWPITGGYRWLWSFLPPNDDEVDFVCPRAAPADRAGRWGKVLGYYPMHVALAARALARTRRTEYDAVLAFEGKCGMPYALARTIDDRRWTMGSGDDGPGTLDDGRRTGDDGRRTMDHGSRTMDDGPRTMDDGRRTTDDRRWTMGSGGDRRWTGDGRARGKRPKLVILFFSVKGVIMHTLRAARFGMGAVDRILVPSQGEMGYYERLLGYPRERMEFCPVGVHDPGVFGRQPAAGGGCVFSGGRSDRDYRTLFEAVAGLGCRAEVRTQPFALRGLTAPPNVRVGGMAGYAELGEALAGARCVVVPLQEVRHAAGLSLIVLAMAAGRPVIATRAGGAEEYVTHGENGLLVEPGDAAGLREAIGYVLAHPEEAARMGMEGRARYVLQHTFELMAVRVRRALVEVCAQGGICV
jgi:hypothetical protein